ncbi:unnamed protein product [Lactuca saligna]|uniref:Uncharacterized protein n=1 Tax=Lactuca saligna TaxID=75948 RepID=A0AA35YTC8_LACSI|nr:unnamed protein product [Lactuca saligna]
MSTSKECSPETLYAIFVELLRGFGTLILQAYKDRCVAFIERFTGEKCEKLYYFQPDIYFPKDHFRNSNMQERLDEHKNVVFGNIEEEVLYGAGLIKEVETGHQDVADVDDEEEIGKEDDEEDEDANDDEDNHENPHFFINDNGI